MTTIKIDISCNGDECGECDFLYNGDGWFCSLYGKFVGGRLMSPRTSAKRAKECLAAERRVKGE